MRIAAALLALAIAVPASAQDRQWPGRIWVSVNGGVQSAGQAFDDAFELPLYAESEHVAVQYPVEGGGLFAAHAGYRIWKRVTVGAGVTRYSRRADAPVQASLPHPFFDNQFRQVEGTASALRGETAAHLLIGWVQPVSDRIRVILTAGPSFINVEQTIVTDVQFAETYPYDTTTFTGASTRRARHTASGFNAGADVSWMFTRRVGAGGIVQVTRGRARLAAGNERNITVDAGGVQAGAGIRFFF